MKRFSCLLCLCFAVLIASAQKTTTPADAYYNVKKYGAIGDGKHLDHTAINKAIETCAENGGGTVYLPAGTYLCGSIHLKSHINLLIDQGAVILGAKPEAKAYDEAEVFPDTAYQDGGHTYFHNSLIWAENITDVSITGRGKIDGGGLTKDDHENPGKVMNFSIGTGDKAIALKNCRNILIRDVTIFHGGHFAILLTGCDLINLDNLIIDTNRDGIDLDCCTNGTVSNCKVNSPNDDAICPKSSYAMRKPWITENLVITNCEVSGYKEGTLLDGTRVVQKVGWSSGRIKFGTESNGGFRNCVVSNCTFRNCNGLALEEVDGGVMDNIVVSNITMMGTNHYPIYVTLGQRNRGPVATTHTGTGKNILISNVLIRDADDMSGIQITGSPGHSLENITLQNISIEYKGGGTKEMGEKVFPELNKGYPEPFLLGANPAYGLYARHVKGLHLDNIQITTQKPDMRPAIICNDIDGLDINRFLFPANTDGKSYIFDQVTNLKVDNSPLLK